MKQFQLLRKDNDDVLTRFHVLNSSGDIVGIVTVQNEEVSDLEQHWLGGATQPPAAAATRATPPPAAAATRAGSALAEALKAVRRPGANPPTLARQENPMVSAMLRSAPKNRLSKQAILRGC